MAPASIGGSDKIGEAQNVNPWRLDLAGSQSVVRSGSGATQWSCCMAKKQLIIRGATQMPAAIKKLWGPPPVHPSESQEEYWRLAVAMAQAVEPTNAIEWIYLKDVTDYTWNIRELRKYQAQVIRVAEQKYQDIDADSWAVIARYYATDLGKAELFLDRLDTFESINKLVQ